MAATALLTGRLEIRDLVATDWRAVHLYAADPEVTRHLRWGPNTEAETRAFVDTAIRHAEERPRTAFELAIVWRATHELIGGCGLLRTRQHGEYEIGYCVRRDWWRRGVGSESVRALVTFGFHSLAGHRIYAFVDPANAASARVLEGVGFRREGHLRRDTLVRGEWRDSLVYAMLADEWEPER